MRVTQLTLQGNWLNDVQNRMENLDEVNSQIGSGLRVQKPSDDPSAANRIVQIQEVVARNEQYLKNIGEGVSTLQYAESALADSYEYLVRAKSLAIEGADAGSVSSVTGGYYALADEVSGLRSGVLQTALTKQEGRYLFSGTGGTAPFLEGSAAYRGDSEWVRINMGNGQSAPVNLPGDFAFRETDVRSSEPIGGSTRSLTLSTALGFRVSDGTKTVTIDLAAGTYSAEDVAAALNQAFGAEGANLTARSDPDGYLHVGFADPSLGGEMSFEAVSGDLEAGLGISAGVKNVFGLLEDLEASLRTQEPKSVSALLARLDAALGGLSGQRGLLGSRTRNLEFARDRLEANNLTNQSLRSDLEGVDTAEAVVRLSAEEQAYQTALAAGARILDVSLLDYMS